MSSSSERLRIAACPQCGQSTRLDPSNRWRPFCSERCKLIDLGAWFSEQRSLPADDAPDALDPGNTNERG
jgi:endogenous inhibitor of DNA gyrase (YacG/DUF329 family)